MSNLTQGAEVIGTEVGGGGLEALRKWLSAAGLTGLLALPGALILYFSFNSGGIFEVTTAVGALIVLVAAVFGLAVARRPFAGLSPLGLLAISLLALLGVWTLLSTDWSHAIGRGLISLDRVLLYLAVLALFCCVPSSIDRVRWALRGLLVASAAVSIVGLLSRLLPAVWPSTPGLVSDRLSYPITYWNTFALLVGMACILAAHHTSDEREPPAIRIAAAALLPMLGATLLLTFSRGALVVTALGVIAYVLIARPWGLVGGIVAVIPATAVAVAQTYSSELIQEGTPLTPPAITQGHSLAWTIGGCALAAAVLRAAMLVLDARLARISVGTVARRAVRIGAGCASMVLLIAFVVVGGPSAVHHEYEKFVGNSPESPVDEGGQRGRLLSVGNDGRLPLWKAALDAYQEDPLKGQGAGTYRLMLEKSGRSGYDRYFTYSLYIETLGELGVIGLALLACAMLIIIFGIAIRMRAETRPVFAAAFSLVIAWIVHAGIDIDWQTPAVCIPIFALGGLALSRPIAIQTSGEPRNERRLPEWTRTTTPWPALGLALVLVGVASFPARMAVAQYHLDKSISALDIGACARATDDANDSIAALDTGARPYEVLAMCAARKTEPRIAILNAKAAIAREPENWEPHYVLALAQGSAGLDPRSQASRAAQLDPLAMLPSEAIAAFNGSTPKDWRAAALALPFSIR